MATYIYETIPEDETQEPVRFEIQQSMNDEPLTAHPDSGEPVRRVITGGFGFSVGGGQASPPQQSSGGCGSGCGCHN